MEFRTFGKPDNPAVLLLPDKDMGWEALYAPLKKLESSFCLVLADPAPAESPDQRLAGVERRLLEHFAGRVWGAYGLGEGGTLLLELAARQTVRVRTMVIDGAEALPAQPLSAFPGRIVYWYGSRDRAAKKLLKPLRSAFPELYTVKLKKLKAGERFLDIRPDKMTKRLKRTFGPARVVTMTTLLDGSAEAVWQLILRRDHNAAEKLTDAAEVLRKDEEHILILEGKSSLSGHWSHLFRLEALSPGVTLCTEQLELSGGPLGAIAALRAKKLLKKEHRRWMQTLNLKSSENPNESA